MIVNNYGLKFDGVGSYGEIECDFLRRFDNVKVYTSRCLNRGFFRRVLNFGMTNCFLRAYSNVKKDQSDLYLIEYPFVEWNPFFLLSFLLFRNRVKQYGKKIVLSLHEHGRVNPLRKLVNDILCKKSDFVLVSNEEMKDDVIELNENIYLRYFPSTLYNRKIIEKKVKKDKNSYVYFGLVNKSKAFDQMIKCWDDFNKDKNKKLYILSGSLLDDYYFSADVVYKYMADDDEILEIMKKSAFCIVPIIPYIDEKNSTFKTAAITGCISIGKFGDVFNDLDFVIHMDNYDKETFMKALNYSTSFDDSKIELLSSQAERFSKPFEPEYCLNETRNILLEIAK